MIDSILAGFTLVLIGVWAIWRRNMGVLAIVLLLLLGLWAVKAADFIGNLQ